MRRFVPLLTAMLLGCAEIFEYSPNQVANSISEKHLNERNLSRLFETEGDDTVTIAFIGDSQRFYDDVGPFVNKVNETTQVDFVLIAGDLTDFGLLQELNWLYKDLKKLNAPYLAVIGNHDAIGNGNRTFERYFGPTNQSFTYKGYKFLLHNTNSREYDYGTIPDIGWLHNELTDGGAKYFVGVSHIPPYDGDFDFGLEEAYHEQLKNQSRFILSLHGHQHRFTDSHYYNDHVRYMTSGAFSGREFVLIQLVNGKVSYERIQF